MPRPLPQSHNLRRHSITCIVCRGHFVAARSDAVFCSGKCRQADYRLRCAAARAARRDRAATALAKTPPTAVGVQS